MPKPIKTYPFTENQLRYFKKEIEDAGGINELLILKEALIKKDKSTVIAKYDDIEAYKEKHLVGIYEPLRTVYCHKIPYVFWIKLFTMYKKYG
jgi:hypothetical protein